MEVFGGFIKSYCSEIWGLILFGVVYRRIRGEEEVVI